MLNNKCYIIAEIGVNHAGSVELAKKMIDSAKLCGADAVKFQTFTAEKLVSENTPKVKYQKKTTNENESHYEMIKKLEFKYKDHIPVFQYCRDKNIDFISTPYDVESAKFLVSIGVKIFKTASADIVDLSLHEYISQHAEHAIISTGMASLGEIEVITNIYRKSGCSFTLLHCVSNYPCAYESLNLNVLTTLSKAFVCNVGYSDHALGNLGAVCSIALGAKIVEKHFTLDKSMDGPDHKASSDPEEFKSLVDDIRLAELALGSAIKEIQNEEKQMKQVSRKSLFLNRNVKKGEKLSKDDFTLKRPGTGIPEMMLKNILGLIATKDLIHGDILKYGDFSEN